MHLRRQAIKKRQQEGNNVGKNCEYGKNTEKSAPLTGHKSGQGVEVGASC